MALSTYHQKYAERPEADVGLRIATKIQELSYILETLAIKFKEPVCLLRF